MKWIWRGAALIGLLVLLVGATLWWLAGTAPGLRWTTQLAQRSTGGKLDIANPQGALGGTMRFDRIAYALEGTTVEALGVEVRIDLGAAPERTLAVERLHIDRVIVHLAPASSSGTGATTPSLPTTLELPLDVRLDAATIGLIEVVRADATIRVRDLYVSYEGSSEQHRLASLRADTEFGYVGAAGSLATTRPYKIDFGLALLRPGREPSAAPPASLTELPANLRAHLSGTLREPTAAAHAKLAQAQASVRARLTPFDREWPQSLQSVEADATAIDLAALAPTLPHTAITLQTSAQGNGSRLEGALEVHNAQAGPLDRQRVPVASIKARFTTDLASVAFEQLAIDLTRGGAITGRGEVQHEPLAARVDLNADHVDLRALRSDLRATALGGPLQVVVQGPQQQTVSATLTQADIRIGAQAQRNGDVVDITDLQLAARGGAVTGKGRILLAAPTQFNAAVAFSRFDPARFGDFPAGAINGSADIKGRLGEQKHIDAAWTIGGSTLRNQPLASRGRAQLIGERVANVDGSARLGANELVVRGSYGAANDRLSLRIDAPALAQLADALGGQAQASGTVSGAGARLQATVTANATQLRLPAGLSVQTLHFEGHVGMQADAPLALKLVAQRVVTPQATLDKLTLDTTGTRAQHAAALELAARQRMLELSLRGGWSGQWPGKWAGELATARLRGALPGDAIVQLAAPASLAVAPANVAVHDLKIQVRGGPAPAAEFRLADLTWEPDRFSSSGVFDHLSTRWLAAFVSLPPGVETTVSLAGAWSIRAQPRLSGTLSIHRDDGDVRLVGPPVIDAGLSQATLDARFDEGRISAQLDVSARLAKVQAHATIDPAAGAPGIAITPESPLGFTAQLDIAELRLISEPLQTFARLSGRVAANTRGSGTLGAPRIEGTLGADSLGVDVPPYGIQLVDGRVRAELQGDSVNVTELTIRGGDGRFTASGTLPLRSDAARAELAWRAETFRLLNRPDMRLVLTGNGGASVADKKVALRGEIRADQGHFELARQQLPAPGEDVMVAGKEAPARGPARVPLNLDLQLDLGKDLSLQGFGLNGKVTGRLHLTTIKEGELRAAGRVEAVDALFRAYGQQLVVDPGVLVFDGPIDNPSLQITAWRRNQQVEAGVQLSGTAKAPLVTLVSEPQVPEGERLSWLVLGRAPGTAQGADLALLQAAAGAFLGGGDSVPMTQKIANSIGLDELAVRGSSEIASSVVAVGKRLSDRLLVTYEHGLGAAAENLVKLDYSLTRRISLRAETGTTTGFGVFYRFAWD